LTNFVSQRILQAKNEQDLNAYTRYMYVIYVSSLYNFQSNNERSFNVKTISKSNVYGTKNNTINQAGDEVIEVVKKREN
jgi:hypothetical protein